MLHNWNHKALFLLMIGLSGCARETGEAALQEVTEAATTGGSATLKPEHLAVIANGQVAESRDLAQYYVQRRGVPADRIILLDVKFDENIDRATYEEKVASVVRQFLAERNLAEQVKCLVTVYGVPLRVGGASPTEEQTQQAKELEPQAQAAQAALKTAQDRLKELQEAKEEAAQEERQSLQQKLPGLRREAGRLEIELQRLRRAETHAALDSELSLLWWPQYELFRWQLNPLYFQIPDEDRARAPRVLMVSRLDAATPELARGLVDQALAAERDGLNGRVYLDARGLKYDPQADPSGTGYGGYDESLRELARLLQEKTKWEVTLDDRGELFQSGNCPNAALYCGWYSLAKYVDAFTWAPGAVAYHIASSEASTLHQADSPIWCNQMLQRGVAATLGPVSEPYLLAFPRPAEFFASLLTGQWTLAECYYRTLLLNSWMMTLIGDPLYNPFRDRPPLSPEDIRPSPVGSKKVWEEEE